MKRIFSWVILTVIVAIVFVGFGVTKTIETKRDFNVAFEAAKKQIKKEQYTKAEATLEDALRKKQNDELGQAVLKQIQLYRMGLENISQKNYAQARQQMQQVAQIDPGSALLVRRASEKQTELKEAIKELAVFDKAYTKALSLSKKSQYTASNTKLAVILNYGSIDKPYYTEIYQKAKKLTAKNNKILKRLGYTVDDDKPKKTDK